MTPPRAAATVVLLRDSIGGLQVFMIERSRQSNVLGGAHVFPGGKLDPVDCDAVALERAGAIPAQLRARLAEPDLDLSTAGGLFVAACRELLEEAGVLLARGAVADDARTARAEADAGVGFLSVLAQLGLEIEWDAIVPWSRWITPTQPEFSRARFDARFFIACMPKHQLAQHDDHEASASFWQRPRDVLEQYWAGQISLAPAQIMSLAQLARYKCATAAMEAARSRPPPLITMENIRHEEFRAIAFPGDARHPVAERALDGPSFLVFRDERFEPLDGLAALLN